MIQLKIYYDFNVLLSFNGLCVLLYDCIYIFNWTPGRVVVTKVKNNDPNKYIYLSSKKAKHELLKCFSPFLYVESFALRRLVGKNYFERSCWA